VEKRKSENNQDESLEAKEKNKGESKSGGSIQKN
jgi:hypothetical protein